MKYLDIISTICQLIYEQLDHDKYINCIEYEFNYKFGFVTITIRSFIDNSKLYLRHRIELLDLEELTVLNGWEESYIESVVANIAYYYNNKVQEVEKDVLF